MNFRIMFNISLKYITILVTNVLKYKIPVSRLLPLIEFQKLNELVVDGIIGSKTKSLLCPSMSYNISPEGIGFIADYESFYSEPYRGLDSQNQTIGYGHVITIRREFWKFY